MLSITITFQIFKSITIIIALTSITFITFLLKTKNKIKFDFFKSLTIKSFVYTDNKIT